VGITVVGLVILPDLAPELGSGLVIDLFEALGLKGFDVLFDFIGGCG
jgi:hypothetical protein